MIKENKYKIQDISKKYNLTKRTLQYYDDLGLLSVNRLPNGYRVYSQKDLYTLDTIVILKNYGLELSEIKYYLYQASLAEQREILIRAKKNKELEMIQLKMAIQNIDERMLELESLKDITINTVSIALKRTTEYEHLSLDEFKIYNEYVNAPMDNSYMISVFNENGDLYAMAHPIKESKELKKHAYAYYEYDNNFNELLHKFISSLTTYDIRNQFIYSYPILLENNKYLHYFEVLINE